MAVSKAVLKEVDAAPIPIRGGFSDEQIKELSARLDSAYVKKNAKDMDYLEAWFVISEANRIFGFDGWSRELRSLEIVGVPYQDAKGNTRVGYKATVRVIVYAGNREVFKDGTGYGSGIVKDPNDAHEKAMKESETDALKRALKDFGYPFGLALYDKAKENVLTAADKEAEKEAEEAANFAAALEASMATRLDGVNDLGSLTDLYEERKGDLAYVGQYDKAARNRILALFTKRKNELEALQAKEANLPTGETGGATKGDAGTAKTLEASSPAPSSELTENLIINPKSPDFQVEGTPGVTDWPKWGRACIDAVKSIDSADLLDKWVARHEKVVGHISKLTVIGKLANGDDMTGDQLANLIRLWVRRQRSRIAGTNMQMRHGLGNAPGTVTDFHADPDDWADGLLSIAKSPATFGNVAYNLEQAKALVEANPGSEVATKIHTALDLAAEHEAKRKAAQEAA